MMTKTVAQLERELLVERIQHLYTRQQLLRDQSTLLRQQYEAGQAQLDHLTNELNALDQQDLANIASPKKDKPERIVRKVKPAKEISAR